MKFLSEEWLGQYEPMAKSIFAPGVTPTGCNGTFLEVFRHVPAANGDTVWIMYEFEDGLLVEQSHGTGRTPRGADFVVDLDLDLPKKLLKKEVRPEELLDSGLVKFQMNFVKLMPVERAFILMQVLKAINEMKLPFSRHSAITAVRGYTAVIRKGLEKRGVALK